MGPESGLLKRSDLAPVIGLSRAADLFIESCVAISHDATHAPRRSASLRGQSGAEAICKSSKTRHTGNVVWTVFRRGQRVLAPGQRLERA